jgi:hypothetical protein
MSKPPHPGYTAALPHIRGARKAYRDAMGGQRPLTPEASLSVLISALGRITEHYPPDTLAGKLAADALARIAQPDDGVPA